MNEKQAIKRIAGAMSNARNQDVGDNDYSYPADFMIEAMAAWKEMRNILKEGVDGTDSAGH